MTNLTYPGLYKEADGAANRQQSRFLGIIGIEYAALFVVSLLSINIPSEHWYIAIYGAVLAIALGALIARTMLKPEQAWYQARALAESVKTTAWKYAMQSRPFDQGDGTKDRESLRRSLRELLNANRHIGKQFDGSGVNVDQITHEMEHVRSLAIPDRLALYMSERVKNQRSWYAGKAKKNRTWSRRSVSALVILYALAFGVFVARVIRPDWLFAHPDPIILLAAAMIGWMQIKKFNELATSYNLTAIEIGILESKAPEIVDHVGLSNFVDDSEEAFSREHTQWLARRSN